MNRRDMLLTTGAAAIGVGLPARLARRRREEAAQSALLYPHAGFEHPPVTRKDDQLSESEKLLTKWGKKDGHRGRLHQGRRGLRRRSRPVRRLRLLDFRQSMRKVRSIRAGGPISAEGKKKFLAAIGDGKGFVGIHSSTDSFHSPGVDPYIAMIGAEFIIHGAQQKATMKVVSPKFPGMEGLGKSFTLFEDGIR